MAAVVVTKENFQEEVINCDKKVLIDFWASWCGPCRRVSPIIDEIAQERDDIKVCKINVDEETELANQYQVMSIPTLLVLKNGEVVAEGIGAMPKNQILELL